MKIKTQTIFLAAGLSVLFLSACSGGGGGGNDNPLEELTVTTETACADGLDDDADGLIDCTDSDCALDLACATAPKTEIACADGLDDDEDGKIDCDDDDCALDATNCPETVEAKAEVCTGGLDEDGDGKIDCDDSDCVTDTEACPPAAFVEAVLIETACADTFDNDSDGKIDCNDEDCADSSDCDDDEQNGAEKEPEGTKEFGFGLSTADKDAYRISNLISNVQAGPSALEAAAVFTQVSAGNDHTCGVKNDGTVWCWGSDEYKQLGNGDGDGDTENKTVPVKVSDLVDFRQVRAGYFYTCGVKADHTVWCWGNGDDGQLGNESTEGQTTPVWVSGSTYFIQVSAGESHTCGVKGDGTVFCWGNNGAGQLGIGDCYVDKSTIPVDILDSGNFTQVGAGYYHTCGVKNDGNAWCWGWGSGGLLGNGDTAGQYAPVKVSGSGNFTQVSTGYYHACGLKEDGTVWCWGNGTSGQLGNGDAKGQTTPVKVKNSIDFAPLVFSTE